MVRSKKQHFVPKFYLRNFSRDKHTLFCFDKMKFKSFRVNIADIAHENLFYDVNEIPDGVIERNLSYKEALFKLGYSQLVLCKDIERLDEASRKALFLFITTQFFRTSFIRKDIKQTSDQFINILAKKSGVKIPDGFRIYTDPESVKRIHLLMILDSDMIFQTADILANSEWLVLSNDTGLPLWTSDNPVVIDNNTPDRELGLASKGREIHFVLNPQLCLTSFDPLTHRRPTINNLEYMNVLYHNCLQIRRSMRFIYSSDDDFSLAQKFLIDYPQYKNPNLTNIKVY